MSSLFDPTDVRPLHFLGIGGAGMSALALAARRRGVAVTGDDVDTAAFPDLIAAGATVWHGHAVENIGHARAIIATAAARSDHPELVAARAAGIPVVYRKQALAELVNGTTLVAIAGTHGKTTTTVMTTTALAGAGFHPSGLAGGRVAAWHGNALLDRADLFVVEADEYDQAFLTLQPTIAVINNVEADHLECYGTVDQMEAAFAEFAGRAQRAVIGNADEGSDRVAAMVEAPVWRFGVGSGDLAIVAQHSTPERSVATVRLPGERQVQLELQVPGLHNLRNAVAALGVVCALDAPLAGALAALGEFTGVGRRFERVGTVDGITLVDDYAHHPTELVATLAAARQAFPRQRLVAVFQPHLYSRTEQFADEMGKALAAADLAIVTDVYGAREAPVPGITGKLVADAVQREGGAVVYHADRPTLAEAASTALAEGDVLITMGAGDVTAVSRELRALRGAR